MAKIFLWISVFILVGISSCLWAFKNNHNNDDELIVLDMRNTPDLPKRFRIPQKLSSPNINWQGFAKLNMMGSGQFSKASFEKILQKFKITNLTVIDLRQESHGFLNGNAISWYGFRNAINTSKTDTQIETAENNALKQLESKESLVVKLILHKASGKITKFKNTEFSVHSIASEEDYILQQKLNYIRLYVQDFHAPELKQVNQFIKIVKVLPNDHWLYFHCRAGAGRTSTFMVMYDMMRNAKLVSFDEILARQVAIGGKDLTQLPDKADYKHKPAQKRLAFLKSFYEYARANTDNFETPYKN